MRGLCPRFEALSSVHKSFGISDRRLVNHELECVPFEAPTPHAGCGLHCQGDMKFQSQEPTRRIRLLRRSLLLSSHSVLDYYQRSPYHVDPL